MVLPGVFVRELKGHQGPVRAVRFNVNGNYCLTCGNDKLLKLWNPYSGVELKSYGGHGYEVLDAVASNDSGKVASCSADRTVVLWDVSNGQIIRKFRGHISVSATARNLSPIMLYVDKLQSQIGLTAGGCKVLKFVMLSGNERVGKRVAPSCKRSSKILKKINLNGATLNYIESVAHVLTGI